MNYEWKISEVTAEDDLITHAKYHVTLSDEQNEVATEGNWWFANPKLTVAYSDVTEEMVAQWIENEAIKDGVNVIKSRLEEQLALLNKSKSVVPPWKPQVFALEIT